MGPYLNAALMLAATVAAFLILARALGALREGRLSLPWGAKNRLHAPQLSSRLAIEQACIVDAKRRLLLVRADGQRFILVTGGPADLIVPLPPVVRAERAVP